MKKNEKVVDKNSSDRDKRKIIDKVFEETESAKIVKEIQTVPKTEKSTERAIENSNYKNDKQNDIKKREQEDSLRNGSAWSPLTGDFFTKTHLKIALIIQGLALLVIIITLKKEKQGESRSVTKDV